MFRKPPSKKSSQSALEVASLQKVIVNLDEPSEEALLGGAIALPSFLNQAHKETQAEGSASSLLEAEGKIRGTLLLTLA